MGWVGSELRIGVWFYRLSDYPGYSKDELATNLGA